MAEIARLAAATIMPAYRVYLVDEGGHFVGREEMTCADDDEARKKAERFSECHAIEVWDGVRLVHRQGQFPVPIIHTIEEK